MAGHQKFRGNCEWRFRGFVVIRLYKTVIHPHIIGYK